MDWIRLLEENNIGYVTRGPNTKKGEVSIKCPMCGQDDPSEHLGINLSTGNWGCHRNSSHRGKSSRTLIKAMLGCSSRQAGDIVKQYDRSDPDTLDQALSSLINDIEKDDLLKKIEKQKDEPKFTDFIKIRARGVTKRFFRYLQEDRKFEDPYEVIDRYKLRCALTGKYKDRIILPVSFNDEVIGWTSRALGTPIESPRYLASSEDIKTVVFNYDELKKGGQRLFIVEGPFDAINIDNFGVNNCGERGIRATCTFGTSVTLSQIVLLRVLIKKFDEAWVLFDQGAEFQGEDLAYWINSKLAYLPQGVKDPGELSSKELSFMIKPNYNGVGRVYYDNIFLNFPGNIQGSFKKYGKV